MLFFVTHELRITQILREIVERCAFKFHDLTLAPIALCDCSPWQKTLPNLLIRLMDVHGGACAGALSLPSNRRSPFRRENKGPACLCLLGLREERDTGVKGRLIMSNTETDKGEEEALFFGALLY